MAVFCNYNSPFVGMPCWYALPNGADYWNDGIVTAVHSGNIVDLTYNAGTESATGVHRVSCPSADHWGCPEMWSACSGIDAWRVLN